MKIHEGVSLASINDQFPGHTLSMLCLIMSVSGQTTVIHNVVSRMTILATTWWTCTTAPWLKYVPDAPWMTEAQCVQ